MVGLFVFARKAKYNRAASGEEGALATGPASDMEQGSSPPKRPLPSLSSLLPDGTRRERPTSNGSGGSGGKAPAWASQAAEAMGPPSKGAYVGVASGRKASSINDLEMEGLVNAAGDDGESYRL